MTAPITGKLFLISVAPIFLVAAALAGGFDWPTGNSNAQVATAVEGDPVSCPDGRIFASSFELDGSRFHVLGPLTAMEGRAAVIAGPTGDVPITLSDSAAVSTGLIIGEPVDATGTVDELGAYIADSLTAVCAAGATASPGPTPAPEAPTGTPTPTPAPALQLLVEECNRGPGHAGDLRLEIKDGEVKIKRSTVVAFTDGMLTVDTPGGPLSVMITSDTEIKGDLSIAAEVRIEGDFDDGGNIVAEEARALCPDAAHDDDEVDDHDGATPAIPAIPAVPGGSGDPATPAIPAIPAVPPHAFDDDHEDNGNRGHGGGHDKDDDDEDD